MVQQAEKTYQILRPRDTCSSLQGGYDYPSHHAAAGHQVEIDGVYISEAGESQTEDRADEAVNI